jgi:probable O-glycosylation ligase (exosortase A-associated)
MRDILVTLLVFGSLPLILRKPFFGVLVWTWLGLMNPHKLCWGFAWGFPFALIVALTLLISLLLNQQEAKQLPWTSVSRVLAVFWVWMFITTFFAMHPELAWQQWGKVWKIMLMVFITMMLLTSKERINALVWVMMLSIGFYGVKGGIFTLTKGGGYHVMGPMGSFITGNNEIGLAMIMTIPLMRYIQLTAARQWVKIAMIVSMALTLIAILGTQSRGAFLGGGVMILYLIAKSRKRIVLMVLLVAVLPAAFNFMPESWHERMASIAHYQQDASAEGRIEAWWTSWYLALDHPIVGGGFDALGTPLAYWLYLPGWKPGDPTHDVHSIYFEALSEHGFVGLFLFLVLAIMALSAARSIVRQTRNEPRLYWIRDLASMIHVSLIGYAVSGAFLGLAYFDFYYALLAVIVGLQRLLPTYKKECEHENENAVKEQLLPTAPVHGSAWRYQGAKEPYPQRRSRLLEWFEKL